MCVFNERRDPDALGEMRGFVAIIVFGKRNEFHRGDFEISFQVFSVRSAIKSFLYYADVSEYHVNERFNLAP